MNQINRIVIVAHNLRYGGGLSVGKNLIESITKNFKRNQYLLIVPSNLGYENIFPQEISNIKILYFNASNNIFKRVIFDFIKMPNEINKFGPSTILCLGNFSVFGVSASQSILLHNPFMCFPFDRFRNVIGLRDLIQVKIQRYIFKNSLKKIKILFCQTETMSNHVRNVYDFNGIIHILPNVLSRIVDNSKNNDFNNSNINKINFYSRKKILFCLTAYYPHKNLEVIIKLLNKYRSELNDFVFILTISENQNKAAKKLLEDIVKYDLSEYIINIGPVNQEDLSKIYKKSYALFLPTILESFSGTYLESMRFNIPILTSSFDFAHEVCKDAALYFNPKDIDDIFEKIINLESYREILIKNGIYRYNTFDNSWDEISIKTMNLIIN